MIEFTDDRWVPKLSQFPMVHPIRQIACILPAQLRHKTGEIRVPPEAEGGEYDLVVIASPTWWFQTSMPIRSYLESPSATVSAASRLQRRRSRGGTSASTSASRRSSPRKPGGRFTDKTHFVVAGGQVKSMLSWLDT